jgi:hypothetical protein
MQQKLHVLFNSCTQRLFLLVFIIVQIYRIFPHWTLNTKSNCLFLRFASATSSATTLTPSAPSPGRASPSIPDQKIRKKPNIGSTSIQENSKVPSEADKDFVKGNTKHRVDKYSRELKSSLRSR